jgi:hypothetical protein
MSQYDNTNRGALFRNDRATSDKHPTHKGSINVNGQEFWLSAWVKEGQKGKFFSLSVEPKEQQEAPKPDRAGQWKAAAPKAPQRQERDFEDDSLPF